MEKLVSYLALLSIQTLWHVAAAASVLKYRTFTLITTSIVLDLHLIATQYINGLSDHLYCGRNKNTELPDYCIFYH